MDMKVTLQLKDGRVINFSDVENISILEDITSDGKQVLNQTAQIPTEGKWFEVNPSTINQNLFIARIVVKEVGALGQGTNLCKTTESMRLDSVWETQCR